MLQPSDEIKAKLNVVDVIRDYIPVKPAGINFRAKCPFHNEKTPSFIISPEKQIWHCFGCQKGGDIFSFVMEMENVDFAGALRILAPKAGVTLQRQDPKMTSEKNRILDILNLSRRYYHKVLLESKMAEVALEYLKKRGMQADTIEEWQIGFSPDNWDATYKFLQSKGYNEKEIFLAGMSVKSQNMSGYYDRFRGRIMFPINEANGNTIAFTARVSPEKEATEKLGKYINSPQTIVYDKSKVLFGFDKAKQEIKKHDSVILVEGQMDVITAHQNNWKNVVASSGTALTLEQVNLIKRLTSNIYLAFDMDKAGELAADRGIREAMNADMSIKIIEVPEGKDPDECIKNNLPAWELAVKNAKPMMQYYLDKTFAKFDIKQVAGKQQSAKFLLPIIAKLGNKVEQSYWLKQLAEALDVPENVLRETINDFINKKPASPAPIDNSTKPIVRKTNREEKLSNLLLAILLKFNVLIEYAQNHLDADYLVGVENQAIYKRLVFYYNNVINHEYSSTPENSQELINFAAFREWILTNNDLSAEPTKIEPASQDNFAVAPQNLVSAIDVLAITGDEEFYNKEFVEVKEQLIKIVAWLEKNYLTRRMKEVTTLISEAEKKGDKEAIQSLMREFKILSDELKSINVE